MRFSRKWMVSLMFVLAACNGSGDGGLPSAPAATLEARQGETFRLRPGQTARVGDLLVAFRGIAADSRCPADVVCVWEGDATARVRVGTDTADLTPFDLHTALEPKAIEFGARTVTLVKVEPYPYSSSAIDPARYVVTLRVD